MSYKLETPYTDEQRADFIVLHNHNNGLLIEESQVRNVPEEYKDYYATTQQTWYALEPNEMMDWQTVTETITIELEPAEYEYVENEDGEVEKVVVKEAVTEDVTVTLDRWVPVVNENYEQEQAEKERARIDSLKVTKRVFALALQEYGVTYAQLKELIATNDQAQLEWDLCVELERSNPLLDVMAAQMGITSGQLDYIFQVANGEMVASEKENTSGENIGDGEAS